MKRIEPNARCSGSCPLTRRDFFSRCTQCAAVLGGLPIIPKQIAASPPQQRPRIRLVFSHTTPEEITWPNIHYDYEGHKAELLTRLKETCPDLEFLPTWVRTNEEADALMSQDGEVDGYVIDFAGMKGGGNQMVRLLGEAQRPAVIIDNLFAGGGNFLGANFQARQNNWKMVGLATSRFSDIAEVVQCFQGLPQSGDAAGTFFQKAERIRKKNIDTEKEFSFVDDPVQLKGVSDCLKQLQGKRILEIGKGAASSAKLDRAILETLGIEVVHLDFPLLDEAYSRVDRREATEQAQAWIDTAARIIEPNEKDVVGSAAMYLAMQSLMKEQKAEAITVHCLKGFYEGHLKAYPCLGFCQMNDDGLVGACEADLTSTVTMLSVGTLTGRPGFISDPVIDTAKNQIIYAHCVAPSKVFGPTGLRNPVHLRSHSEDRNGASLRSLMPLGYLTSSLRIDPQRREIVFHQAKTVENVDLDQACRTKLAAEVKGDVGKLLNGWSYGWHRVTFYGDLKDGVEEFAAAVKMKVVHEA